MTDAPALPAVPSPVPRLEITSSRQFPSWLASTGGSLALTTYQSGKVILLGTKPEGGLAVFERTLERPMGLAVSGARLAVATLTQIITFVDAGAAASTGAASGGPTSGSSGGSPFDAAYIPQVAHFTGDLDVHDMGFDASGRLIFVNTLFGGLARQRHPQLHCALEAAVPHAPCRRGSLPSERACHARGRSRLCHRRVHH